MTIVDRLIHLSTVSSVIPCAEMTLLAGDHDPPVVVGDGEITVLSPTTFGYTLRGTPEDFGHALRSLRRIDADPYDGTLRERLNVETADGLALSGGWTIPKLHVPDGGGQWTFTGEIDSLVFHDDGTFEAGTEVAYLLPRQHRARIILRRFFPEAEDGHPREKALTVNGSALVLILDDDADRLLVRAPATAVLPPTFTENWLGEPLRILFGQPVYPRFVLRQSEQWSMGWIRPSPAWSHDSDACALWQGPNEYLDADGFWNSYRRLLSYVAGERHPSGYPNFEANNLTDLYGEVIQAAHGSRWVWALTYASAVEGMVQLLGLEGQPRTDLDAAALAELTESVEKFKAYVDLWDGDERPKEPAKNAAARLLTTTAVRGLRQLRSEGWIGKDELAAWEKLRNRVMHGTLVSPDSSAEEDKLLLDLASLFRSLTRRLLADVDPDRVSIVEREGVGAAD